MTAAWTVATLSRAKSIPRLDKFLGPDLTRRTRRRKPAMSMEMQKARLLSWARANGVKAETTTES